MKFPWISCSLSSFQAAGVDSLEPHLPVVMPSLELRRSVQAAQELRLHFRRLNGLRRPSDWLSEAAKAPLELVKSSEGCVVDGAEALECREVPKWIQRLLMTYPYPLLEADHEEIHCSS